MDNTKDIVYMLACADSALSDLLCSSITEIITTNKKIPHSTRCWVCNDPYSKISKQYALNRVTTEFGQTRLCNWLAEDDDHEPVVYHCDPERIKMCVEWHPVHRHKDLTSPYPKSIKWKVAICRFGDQLGEPSLFSLVKSRQLTRFDCGERGLWKIGQVSLYSKLCHKRFLFNSPNKE